ncbi:MAG: hypothetical protein OSW77_12615, partial [Proteobacteria bacterium]|nr:hypothetical protein [Pseudomonadota bacterium]
MTVATAPSSPDDRPRAQPLELDENLLDRLAAVLLERAAAWGLGSDLSSLLVIVPALPVGAELRQALARLATGPLLMPTVDTLGHWVDNADLPDLPEALSDSARLVLLHEA